MRRIDLIDFGRSAAVLAMLIYHFVYDLAYFGLMSWQSLYSQPWSSFQIFSSSLFILIAGISSRLSKNNIRRGFKILLCALLVSAGSYFVGLTIWFGILHFLGFSMIFYGSTERYLDKIPRFLAPFLYAALFLLTKLWTAGAPYVSSPLLFPFGFMTASFQSADYFPLLPWLFLFLMGTWVGEMLIKHRDTPWLNISVPPPLTFPGRHSLAIYLLHQPVIYAAVYALAILIK